MRISSTRTAIMSFSDTSLYPDKKDRAQSLIAERLWPIVRQARSPYSVKCHTNHVHTHLSVSLAASSYSY